jgi:hypothetical protein
MNKNTFLICFICSLFILLAACESELTKPEEFDQLEVDIRMEIQILDSVYQIYSRPFTQIYFTTYKLGKDNKIYDFEQSDTTSCPNGWGVKILNYKFKNAKENIVLGAACDNYDGNNYREIVIDYEEAQRRIDSIGHASIIKTFAIYYK